MLGTAGHAPNLKTHTWYSCHRAILLQPSLLGVFTEITTTFTSGEEPATAQQARISALSTNFNKSTGTTSGICSW